MKWQAVSQSIVDDDDYDDYGWIPLFKRYGKIFYFIFGKFHQSKLDTCMYALKGL